MRNDFNIQPYDKKGYIFIAATPRSGTQYIAHVLQAVGIDVKHEAFGERGISAFHIIPHSAICKQGLLIHQIRDPLKTIASMQVIDKSWPYLVDYTGINPRIYGKLYSVMKLWLVLNSHIEQYADYRYRVEDIDTEWPKLCNMIGIKNQPIPNIPRNTHTRKGHFRALSWHELEFRDNELTKYIKEMAVRYGYKLDS